MFSIDTVSKVNNNPFANRGKKQEDVVKNNNENVFYINHYSSESKVKKEKELIDMFKMEEFFNILINKSKELNITKLFNIEIDEKVKKTIDISIQGRKIVSEKNDLPEFMARDNQNEIDVKSLGTEIPFSYFLRGLNRGNKYKLYTPELNTITPNKDKPDYIIYKEYTNKVLFDMKGQGVNKAININKIAHDRAVKQGLTFYIVGIVNSEILEELSSVEYYLLPLIYFDKYAKLITNGKYSYNERNHYYQVKLENIKGL